MRRPIVGAFVLALLAGMFLPVYTDEIGWRFQERAGFDGVDKMFSEVCGPNTLARPPFFMMPVRHFSAWLNAAFADPFYIRLSGVLYALLWAGLVLALARRIAPRPERRDAIVTIVVGLLALGVMPLLLVWSRPEQPVVLAATAAVLLALAGSGGRPRPAAFWMPPALVLALGIVAISYHVKGLLLLPLLLCCLWLGGRGRDARAAQAVAALLLAAATAVAAHYWVDRLQCPGDAALRAEYARNNMGLAISEGGGPGALLKAAGALIGNASLFDYFVLPAPRERPLSHWLVARQVSAGASAGWALALACAWGITQAAALVALAGRLPAMARRRTCDPRAALAIMLLGTALAWSATQSIRNVYEASFVIPLVALEIALALSLAAPGGRLDALLKPLSIAIGLAGLLSLAAVAAIYGPSLARAGGQSGYLAAQPNSVGVFGYRRLAPRIERTARLCGIPPPSRAHALMVDEVTYFAFMESRLPQHRLGVVGLWRGSIGDPVAYLKGRGSDGAIVGCHFLPPALRARARGDGEFCCLGPPNW